VPGPDPDPDPGHATPGGPALHRLDNPPAQAQLVQKTPPVTSNGS
jgi:hypothetical protein